MDALRKVRLIDGDDIGTHPVWIVQDRAGRRYAFKPVDSPSYRWRAEVEAGANALCHLWGFETPRADVVSIDGQDGLLMEFVDHVSSFRGLRHFEFLTGEQIGAVAAEHVLDWILDNDDTHASNLLLTTDGSVVGIDKGRALFVYGNWNGLAGDHGAHSNCELVYTTLYHGIRSGALSEEQATGAYRAAIGAARQIQESDDEQVEALVRLATANRPKWSRPGYMTHYTDEQAPTCQDDLVHALLGRKAWLVADVDEMWSRIFAASPYAKPRRLVRI